MKKSIFFTMVVVFFFTGLSMAQPPDVVVGDFENEITYDLWNNQFPEGRTDPNNFTDLMDFWDLWWHWKNVYLLMDLNSSTTGATLNNQSLKVTFPVENQDGDAVELLKLDIGRMPEEDFNDVNEAFFAHSSISMDITIDPADWQPLDQDQPVTFQINFVVNNTDAHWNSDGPDSDDVNPDNPGLWNSDNSPTLQTRTLTWGLKQYQDDMKGETPRGGNNYYFETFIQIVNLTNAAGTGAVYVDNVRFTTPVTASSPTPGFNEQDIKLLPTLTFTPGALATIHNLYFGTDADDVNEATADVHPNVTVTDLDSPSYTITSLLDFNTTYYWRVDETDGSEVWPGGVWKFTTGTYSLIDDFEDYPTTNLAYDDTRIFVTWRDRVAYKNANNVTVPGNGTRMTITDGRPETELIHVYKGYQSLPLTYDNTKSPFISETDRTFDPPWDFTTAHDGQAFGTLDMQIQGQFLSPGTFTDHGNGRYTVVGSGTDIMGRADEFHFAYQPQPVEGAASITAKIESVENVHKSAKGGVMIRDSVGSIEDPGAVYAAVLSLPNGDIVFQYRKVNGDITEIERPEDHEFTLPYWVRISTDGRYITPQMSADGQDWVNIVEPNQIDMYNYTAMGLAVSSRIDAGTACTAEFSNVSLEGVTDSLDVSVDIGLPKNEPENVYVRLEDNNGASETANYEDDPNGTLIEENDEYKLFSTPLSAFTGVDLTQIKKIVIGVGPNNGQKASEGKLYVDDVRLSLLVSDSNDTE